MNYYYITGTSKGIGRALAENILNNENNFIYGISRSEAIAHSNFEQITLDLADVEEVRNFTFRQHKDAESIVLINNAGILGKIRQVGRFDLEEITLGFNVNLIAPAILMNKFISTFRINAAKKSFLILVPRQEEILNHHGVIIVHQKQHWICMRG
jgi:benzil reductase ((S)-benzoin forming)